MRLLATRADMDQLCVYDIQQVNWRAVREALCALPDHDQTLILDDGSHFPWWVWLANTGVLRDVVHEGVAGVELKVARGHKYVLVRSVAGEFSLWCNEHGKMAITPAPRK